MVLPRAGQEATAPVCSVEIPVHTNHAPNPISATPHVMIIARYARSDNTRPPRATLTLTAVYHAKSERMCPAKKTMIPVNLKFPR